MSQVSLIHATRWHMLSTIMQKPAIAGLFCGLIYPFGFAPFHFPAAIFLSQSLLFILLQRANLKHAITIGFFYGMGSMGLGVSWVFVSIHEYGHLNHTISALITILFIAFLSTYNLVAAGVYVYLKPRRSLLLSACLFSSIWVLGEYIRSILFGGFPWLITAYAQVDTTLKYMIPILGFYGTGFLAILSASSLGAVFVDHKKRAVLWLFLFSLILLTPTLIKSKTWSKPNGAPLSVAVIQANLSMRDKWDEALFYQLVSHYYQSTEKLLKDNQLIVMPESAIPAPTPFIHDFIDSVDNMATQNGSAVLFGTLVPDTSSNEKLYNAMLALGEAKGYYAKRQLVPFGEYIPRPFEWIIQKMGLPASDLKQGLYKQNLIHIKNIPIASLVCYELAYPKLLRSQLPEAQWIVSISDDGWFGHSFAMYQQQQIAQAISLLTSRYQVMANNDGLSSVIDTQGTIIKYLKPYTRTILQASIQPMSGATPWTKLSDFPILLLLSGLIFIAYMTRARARTNRNTT